MNPRAILAVLGLLTACGRAADSNDPPRVEQVQPVAFHSQHGLYFKVVDDSSTYMQSLFDHVPIDHPEGVTAQHDRYLSGEHGQRDEYYLAAASPEPILHYLASDPSRSIPKDRELAFQQLDDHRWRAVLLMPSVELDETSIASATTSDAYGHPAVEVQLTPAGARRFGDLTARIAGHKLAIVADGVVVSAPVIQDAIRGGKAQITLGPSATDADADALAASLGKT